jgi:hypothetical protein
VLEKSSKNSRHEPAELRHYTNLTSNIEQCQLTIHVIPAQAGIHFLLLEFIYFSFNPASHYIKWIPACAGMTYYVRFRFSKIDVKVVLGDCPPFYYKHS